MKILLLEDEPKIARLIEYALQKENHIVTVLNNGKEAEKIVETEDYDMAILDIMVPEIDGIAVCKHIRKLKLKWPILFLTAKVRQEDIVKGLDAGADDYLKKPFELSELFARIRALSRRETLVHYPTITYKDIEFDQNRREFKLNNQKLELTNKEFILLDYLIRHQNQLCSRIAIGEHIWGDKYKYTNQENIMVNNLVSRVRKKMLSINNNANWITTLTKVGYGLY